MKYNLDFSIKQLRQELAEKQQLLPGYFYHIILSGSH